MKGESERAMTTENTRGDRGLVTIDGLDGSGKSILARRLAEALPDAVLLGVDDFRRPVDWQAPGASELDLYYEQRYDLAALEGCVRAFLEGADACAFPEFDGAREALTPGPDRTVSFTGRRWLLVEGVFVARLPSADRGLSIYVDISADEARRRVMARDLGKGRTAEEVTRRIDRRYFPAHERYQRERSPRDRAAVLIDNEDPERPRLLRAPPRPPAAPAAAPPPSAASSRNVATAFAPVQAALAALLTLSP